MSADLQRIIKIVFEGDDQTQKAFAGLSSSFGQFEKAVTSVTVPLAAMADKMLELQAAATGLAATGLAVAVTEAGNFREAIAETATLIQDSTFNMEGYGNQILDYSRGSTQSIEDITGALYSAVSAGISWEDAIGSLTVAENLSTAGRASLKDTTVLIASAMNAYGESIDQAERYSDVFFNTVRLGQTTVPELAASLGSVTGIAAAAGVPVETLGAAFATLTAKGMNTAEASTAIKGAINAIITPSSQAAEAAERLRIGFSAGALKAKAFEGVLLDVYKATGGNVEEIAKLFGNIRGLTGVLQAFGKDGGEKFRKNLHEISTQQGVTAEAAKLMGEQWSNVNQNLVNNIRATLINIGAPLLNEFLKTTQSLSGAFANLSVGFNDGAFDPVYDALNTALGGLGDFIQEVGEALPEAFAGVDWQPLIAGFTELGGTVQGLLSTLFTGLDPTKPEELQEILQTLVDSLGNLAQMASGILEEWKPVLDFIGNLVKGFAGMDAESAKASGSIMGSAQVFEVLRGELGFVGAILAKAGMSMLGFGTDSSKAGGAVKLLGDTISATADATIQETLAYHEMAGGMDALRGKSEGLGKVLKELDKTTADVAITATLDENKVDEIVETMDAITTYRDLKIFLDIEDPQDVIATIESIPEEKMLEYVMDVTGMTPDEVNALLDEIPEDLRTLYQILLDGKSKKETEDAVNELEKKTQDPKTVVIDIDDQGKIRGVKEGLAEIPAEKFIDFKVKMAELDTRSLEARMGVITAKIQAEAQVITATFESLNTSISSTGETLVGLYGLLGDSNRLTGSQRYEIEQAARAESEHRKKSFELQERLSNAQIGMLESRRKAMDQGQGMIQIDGQGLQPHLEAFMWEVLAAIQVRVNEEGMDMLLGMGA